MQISISDALQQLRDELRKAVLEGENQDILFTPNSVEIELGVNFTTEAKGGGGFKIFAVIDVSAEATVARESQHKVKLSLQVTDKSGKPLKIRSAAGPRGLSR